MPTLTPAEYGLVTNVMSLCIAAMFAGALFLFFSRSQVAPAYRPALLISALVPAIACYHYFRIHESFTKAFELTANGYMPSGLPFNDAYRYADWLLTVPLLLVELVAVLALRKEIARSLTLRLSAAALLMIALGYPGEIATSAAAGWLWWGLAMLPFAYILFVLYTEFSKAYSHESAAVQKLVSGARGLILVTWSFYPIAFLAPMIGLSSATGEVALQVGYTIADILAKVGLGLYIYQIAVAKSQMDSTIQSQPESALATGD